MTSFIDYSSNKIINTIINDFIPYRGLITNAKFTKDEILADIKNIGYIKIETITPNPRGARNKVTFLILSINSKYSHSPELRKLLDIVSNDNTIDELIIIIEEIFFSKKTLLDIVKEYQKNEIYNVINGELAIYNAYPYYNFIENIPIKVFPHRIISFEEIKQNILTEYIKIGDLKVIFTNDPPIIWLGGKDGQVVEIQRDSSTSGIAIDYRRIERKI